MRVEGSECRVEGPGFRVQGSGLRVDGGAGYDLVPRQGMLRVNGTTRFGVAYDRAVW